MLVTGKLWPRVFELALPAPPEPSRIRFDPQAVSFPTGAGGYGVLLRGIRPRATFIVLTATGTATVTDSLPVAILAR